MGCCLHLPRASPQPGCLSVCFGAVQARFRVVYGTQTFSNNNTWLRRKLLEGVGPGWASSVGFLPGARASAVPSVTARSRPGWAVAGHDPAFIRLICGPARRCRAKCAVSVRDRAT